MIPENLTDAVSARATSNRLLGARAVAGGPDALAERLGGVQGGPSDLRRVDAGASETGFWAGLSLARRRLAAALLPRPVLRRSSRVAFGTVDPILQQPQPAWNPLDWDTQRRSASSSTTCSASAAIFEKVFLRTLVYVAIAVVALAPDRIPGRVLRRPVRWPLQRAAARWPARALLHQLPDADARLDQPAPGRRLGERRAPLGPRPRRAAHLARRPRVVGDPRARLRLRAVHDPAALRVPRPDRPERARGRP